MNGFKYAIFCGSFGSMLAGCCESIKKNAANDLSTELEKKVNEVIEECKKKYGLDSDDIKDLTCKVFNNDYFEKALVFLGESEKGPKEEASKVLENNKNSVLAAKASYAKTLYYIKPNVNIHTKNGLDVSVFIILELDGSKIDLAKLDSNLCDRAEFEKNLKIIKVV